MPQTIPPSLCAKRHTPHDPGPFASRYTRAGLPSSPMRLSVSSTRKRVQTTDCLRASSQYLMYVVATTVPSGSRWMPG